MPPFNKLEFYKNLYYKEIERRCDLNNDLSLPIGVTTILSSVFFYFISNFDYEISNALSIIFGSFSAIGIGAITFSIVCLIKSYDSHFWTTPYSYISRPDDIAKFHNDYEKYYEEMGNSPEQAKEKADVEMENYILAAYIRTSTTNVNKNDIRQGNLHKCKTFLLGALIGLFLAFIPYLINNFSKKETITKIEVTNIVRTKSDTLNDLHNKKINNDKQQRFHTVTTSRDSSTSSK